MSDIFRDYSFGGWLRSFRVEKKITLREMARRAKVDVGNYSKMERSLLSPPKGKKEILELVAVLKLNEGQIEMLLSTAQSWHLSRVTERFE